MALDTVTITIVNTNKQPTVLGGGKIDTTVISPTGITTPDTPYTEYIADSLTISDGSISFPLWNRDQFAKIPASSKLVLETENYDEATYYATLNVAGATITLSDSPLTIISVKFSTKAVTVTAASGDAHTATITATTSPEGADITWTSSDEAVATVSGGTVTGVAAGTATITGTITVDGIEATATCDVTVE